MKANKIFRHLLRTWSHHTTTQVATLTVLVGTFTIIAVVFLLHQNFTRVLAQWGESVQLSAYLSDEVDKTDVTTIQKALSTRDEFSQVKYISKDEAAKSFLSQMSSYVPDLLTDSEFGNPLPSSFELTLNGNLSGPESLATLKHLASEIGKINGVEEVSYGQSWIENYASLVKSFSTSSWVLIALLLAGSLFIIGNSIRASVSQRRDEIEILELVGATRRDIITPFLAEGMLTGLIASASSLVICYFFYLWQAGILTESLGFWGLGASYAFLNLPTVFLMLAIGGVFGALGALICLKGINTGWSAAQRLNNDETP